MSCDRRIGQEIMESRNFEKPLLSDIKFVMEKVQRIDPDFLRLSYRFTKFVLSPLKGGEKFLEARNEI